MQEPKRLNDIKLLSPEFKLKFDAWRKEVLSLYPNARVFETLRTKARQERLYGVGRTHSLDRKPITRTLKSNHLLGDAIDIVFNDAKGNPTWSGPYDALITLGKRYGLRNLKPRETCHFEDDGTPYKPQYSLQEITIAKKALAGNSELRHTTENNDLKKQLEETNDLIRKIYNIQK